MRSRLALLPMLFAALTFPALTFPALAADPPEVTLVFLGDRFEPAMLTVPANTKVAVKIENRSAAAMEFESKTMHREKVVPAGGKATVFIGPLTPGSYEFFDDFHPNIKGTVVAR